MKNNTDLEGKLNRQFPILGTNESIPWNIIAPHEKQALCNHGQTLQRLAERGGLDYVELLSVLEDRPFSRMNAEYCRMKVMEVAPDYN